MVFPYGVYIEGYFVKTLIAYSLSGIRTGFRWGNVFGIVVQVGWSLGFVDLVIDMVKERLY